MERSYIYLCLTQTGTSMSKIIQRITKDPYNHLSISLDERLDRMFSFARRYSCTPLIAGFIQEDPDKSTFKRFPHTQAVIIRVEVLPETYDRIAGRLNEMYSRKFRYHYNFIGLLYAAFGKVRKKKNSYYCSEFIAELLQQNGLLSTEQKIYHPSDFLSYPGDTVYRGILKQYRATLQNENRASGE